MIINREKLKQAGYSITTNKTEIIIEPEFSEHIPLTATTLGAIYSDIASETNLSDIDAEKTVQALLTAIADAHLINIITKG